MIETTVKVEIDFGGEVWVKFENENSRGTAIEAFSVSRDSQHRTALRQWVKEQIKKQEPK